MARATMCAAVLGLLTCAGTAGANTIYVHWNGSGDYTTIQAGMDAAATGDEVVVASGTYYISDPITYDGKEIMLRSEFSHGAVIDCQGVTNAVFLNGEGADARLLGFTIRNGHTAYGGGIRCQGGTSATISDCLITNCSATEYGGGIYAHQSNVTIMATEIMWCSASLFGGGIYSYWGADAGFYGLIIGGCSAPVGGGMYLWGSSPAVHLCTLYRNSGGAIHVVGSTAGLTIMQSILAFSASGVGVSCEDGATPFVGSCDIYGNAGGDDVCGTTMGNGNEDPRFCDIDEGDVRLCANSGCLPGGIFAGLIGAEGQGCVDCTAPVWTTTWGAVKALYR